MNRRAHSLLTAGVVLCTGVLLSSFVGWGFKQRVESEAADRFAFVCEQITQSIHRRLEAVELILRGGAAVFAASESVDRQEWKSYVDTLQAMNELPGLRGVGFAEHLPVKLIDRHHATVRADGFPDYAIHPANEARTVFAPVTYIEPFSASNRHSLGFDLFSVPETRSAMEKACDTSDAALTGRLRLPLADTEGKKRNGALMFIPVYRKDAPKETFDERSQALIGWTFSPLLQDDLINGILEPWDQQEGATLDLEIRDGLDRASATPLFDGKTGHTASADSLFYQ
ncbi:MAG: CHASE domain-containing protein, partial [Propionivibrio sp.]|nr:CHASE domain-containing protein [Propionivibrio sp.]